MHTRTLERIALDNAPAATADDVLVESRGVIVAQLHSITHALRMVRALTMKGEPWRLASADGRTLACS